MKREGDEWRQRGWRTGGEREGDIDMRHTFRAMRGTLGLEFNVVSGHTCWCWWWGGGVGGRDGVDRKGFSFGGWILKKKKKHYAFSKSEAAFRHAFGACLFVCVQVCLCGTCAGGVEVAVCALCGGGVCLVVV